jgi:hypothetical protein
VHPARLSKEQRACENKGGSGQNSLPRREPQQRFAENEDPNNGLKCSLMLVMLHYYFGM